MEAADPESAGRRFLWALALATAIPYFGLPVLQSMPLSAPRQDLVRDLFIFFGAGGHVSASFFFYLDPRMRALLSAHPWRYFVVPGLLLAGTPLLFLAAGETGRATALVAYFAWQTHHYTRQNIGILAFASRATGTAAPSLLERAAVTTSGFAGVIGMVTLLTPYALTPLAPLGWQLDVTALLVFTGALGLSLAALPAVLRQGSPWRTVIFLGGVLFYLPTFLFRDVTSAILSYAMAHGLQYLVFMYSVVGKGRPGAEGRLMMSVVVLLSLGGGGLLMAMQRRSIWGDWGETVFAVKVAITMIHFVLDAGVWRLSEPFQRSYMAQRFSWLARN